MTDQEFKYNLVNLQLCASWYKENINRNIEYKEQRTKPLNNHEEDKEDSAYTKCLELFSQHIDHYNRNTLQGFLNQEELNKRFEKFISNVAFIVKHNNNNNNHHHELGLNQFSDLFENEFPFMTSTIADLGDLEGMSHHIETLEKSKIVFGHNDNDNKVDKYEEYLDWSSKINPDKVSIVHDSQDQGPCGSCWAFASTGTVEASVARNIAWSTYAQQFYLARKIYKKKKAKKIAIRGARMAEEKVMPTVNLSVQELIDCDIDHDMGCVGGNPVTSSFFIRKHGLANASKYSYTGQQGPCNKNLRKKPIASVQSWGILPPNHENNMKLVLRLVGPIAVGINANDPTFTSYKSGIYNSSNCSQRANHALLVVGYGEQHKQNNEEVIKYWIARNSWGKGWGENGYVRIIRGSGEKGQVGVCGIAQSASVAIGATLLNYDIGSDFISATIPSKKFNRNNHANEKNVFSDYATTTNTTTTTTIIMQFYVFLQSHYFLMIIFIIASIIAAFATIASITFYFRKKKRYRISSEKEEHGSLLCTMQSQYGSSLQ